MPAVDPARLLACRCLYAVTEEGAFSHELLNEELQKTGLSTEQRSFATAMLYGTLSRLSALDEVLGRYSQRPLAELDKYLRCILRLGAWQILYAYAVPKYAAVDQSVELCNNFSLSQARGLVNAVLRKIDKQDLKFRKKDLGIELGMGNELFGLFKKWYGEASATAIAEYFLQGNVSTSLRTNPRRSTPQALQEQLEREGCRISPGQYFPQALRLESSERRLDELSAFKCGEFMVQAEAAQAVGYFSQAEEAHYILDLCAAPGGKTCDLAERKQEDAAIVALDLHEGRLLRARENAQRLHLDLEFCQHDALDPQLPFLLGKHWPASGGFVDLILADVPCSGLGDLGSKPELRQRMSYAKIQEFPALQTKFLRQAARLAKAGTRIIYSTCTLNPAENEELVREFLQEEEGQCFSLVDLEPKLPPSLKARLAADAQVWQLLQEGFLLFRPDITGGDGFFMTILSCKE